MGITKDERFRKFEIEKTLQLLQSMQRPIEYPLTPIDKTSLLKKATKRIPCRCREMFCSQNNR
ncbi:hypothetical protein LEPN103867_13795 [Legionella pneumophila subsp. pneumophila]|nr:Uncharacterised protein [Legionella pneumophila]